MSRRNCLFERQTRQRKIGDTQISDRLVGQIRYGNESGYRGADERVFRKRLYDADEIRFPAEIELRFLDEYRFGEVFVFGMDDLDGNASHFFL